MGIRINRIFGPSGQIMPARDLAVKNYIASEGGKWLERARQAPFKRPIDPIRWLIQNKPRLDVYPISFLVSCVHSFNKYFDNDKNIHLTHMFATAYEYIQKNELARAELNKTFQSLGKEVGLIRPYMLKQRVDKSCFTWRKDAKRQSKQGELEAIINDDNRLHKTRIADGYLNMIIEVYLEFIDHFYIK